MKMFPMHTCCLCNCLIYDTKSAHFLVEAGEPPVICGDCWARIEEAKRARNRKYIHGLNGEQMLSILVSALALYFSIVSIVLVSVWWFS